MFSILKKAILGGSFIAAFALNAGVAFADWPTKAITLIVPWAAGGGTDATARVVGEALEKKLGQPVNIVNRTGGGGLVGHTDIVRAKPDGYTLGVITIESAMYQAQGLPGVTPADFDYIGRFNADAIGVNVRADAPFQNINDLLEAVKAAPGTIAASGANRGGLSHLAWVGLLSAAGVEASNENWVASDGSAPALQQLAANAIQVVSTSPAEAKSLVDAGEVKTLALISGERSSLYPDLVTTDEALSISWSPLPFRGVAGPKGLPSEVIEKVSSALEEITKDPAFQEFMTGRGFSVAYQDGAAFKTTVETAASSLAAAMKTAGMAK
jgi:tripartite-type tricarboxylate transporter receptor subunit TctC